MDPEWTEWRVEALLPLQHVGILMRYQHSTTACQVMFLDTQSSPQIALAHPMLHYIMFSNVTDETLRAVGATQDGLESLPKDGLCIFSSTENLGLHTGKVPPENIMRLANRAVVCDYYRQYRTMVSKAGETKGDFVHYWSNQVARYARTLSFECQLVSSNPNEAVTMGNLYLRIDPNLIKRRGRPATTKKKKKKKGANPAAAVVIDNFLDGEAAENDNDDGDDDAIEQVLERELDNVAASADSDDMAMEDNRSEAAIAREGLQGADANAGATPGNPAAEFAAAATAQLPASNRRGRAVASELVRAGWEKHLPKCITKVFERLTPQQRQSTAVATAICHTLFTELSMTANVIKPQAELSRFHGWHPAALIHWINLVPNWVPGLGITPSDGGSPLLVTRLLDTHNAKHVHHSQVGHLDHARMLMAIWRNDDHQHHVGALLHEMLRQPDSLKYNTLTGDVSLDAGWPSLFTDKYNVVTRQGLLYSADNRTTDAFVRQLTSRMRQFPPAPWWREQELWPIWTNLPALRLTPTKARRYAQQKAGNNQAGNAAVASSPLLRRDQIQSRGATMRQDLRRGKRPLSALHYMTEFVPPPAVVHVPSGIMGNLSIDGITGIHVDEVRQTLTGKKGIGSPRLVVPSTDDATNIHERPFDHHVRSWFVQTEHVREWATISHALRRPRPRHDYAFFTAWTDVIKTGNAAQQSCAMVKALEEAWTQRDSDQQSFLLLPRTLSIQLMRYRVDMREKLEFIRAWEGFGQKRTHRLCTSVSFLQKYTPEQRASARVYILHAEQLVRQEWTNIVLALGQQSTATVRCTFSPVLGGQPIARRGLSSDGNSVALLLDLPWPIVYDNDNGVSLYDTHGHDDGDDKLQQHLNACADAQWRAQLRAQLGLVDAEVVCATDTDGNIDEDATATITRIDNKEADDAISAWHTSLSHLNSSLSNTPRPSFISADLGMSAILSFCQQRLDLERVVVTTTVKAATATAASTPNAAAELCVTSNNIDAITLAISCGKLEMALLDNLYAACANAMYDIDRLRQPLFVMVETLEQTAHILSKDNGTPSQDVVRLSTDLHPLRLATLLSTTFCKRFTIDGVKYRGGAGAPAMEWKSYAAHWKAQSWSIAGRLPSLPIVISRAINPFDPPVTTTPRVPLLNNIEPSNDASIGGPPPVSLVRVVPAAAASASAPMEDDDIVMDEAE